MKKLKEIIDKAYNFGKLPKGCHLADFRVLEIVYDDLKNNKESAFFQGTVKSILDKCGIKTTEYGIGWIATV